MGFCAFGYKCHKAYFWKFICKIFGSQNRARLSYVLSVFLQAKKSKQNIQKKIVTLIPKGTKSHYAIFCYETPAICQSNEIMSINWHRWGRCERGEISPNFNTFQHSILLEWNIKLKLQHCVQITLISCWQAHLKTCA